MPCCALVPMAVLMVVWPMLSAGRGPRAFLRAIGIELAALAVIALAGLNETMAVVRDPAAFGPFLVTFGLLLVVPVVLGGVILYAGRLERDEPADGRCRRCGYDLRHSPDRCPECGTPTRRRPEPERL